jgi:hypothetical protein
VQGRLEDGGEAIVRKRTSNRDSVAAHDSCSRVIPLLDRSLEWPNAAYALLEFFLGVTVSLKERCSSLAQTERLLMGKWRSRSRACISGTLRCSW